MGMSVMAWMSRPTYHVPDPVADPSAELTETVTDVQLASPMPDASLDPAESLALAALRPLLGDHRPTRIDAFVDCRSSAITGAPARTCRLAAAAGLTTIMPICLWGEDAPEVINAISVVAGRLPPDGIAVLSAVQRIIEPDTRAPGWSGRRLGDASAAVLLSARYVPGTRPVLAASIGPATDRYDLVADALAAAGQAPAVRMLISDPAHGPLASPCWPDVYFGVADALVRLATDQKTYEGNKVSILVTHGRDSTTAVLVLGTEDHCVRPEELEQRTRSG